MALAAKELEVAADRSSCSSAAAIACRAPISSIGLEDLARKHAGGDSHPLDTTAKLNTAAAFPSGAHVAEVEIDPETGVLEILRYVAVDDCGSVYNHTLVEGQLHRRADAGHRPDLGRALRLRSRQRPVPDRHLHGLLHAARRFAAASSRCIDRPASSPSNPLGAKGAGEAGTTGAIPTVANAVMDALAPLGIHHLEMPYTPHNVWAAIQARPQ